MRGCGIDEDLRTLRAPQESPVRRPPDGVPPGRPAPRGVIVLTVKLFGETLKTPRT
ncbi:hypothetical protein GCM10010327_09240 [Streptomyces nitrosporeus]|nr:hypothetical protein GCM10010327_09240 [Streptomyces nitrosporeus]